MNGQDYIGLAALLTSVGTFIGTMVSLVRGGLRDKKLDTIQTHVNGMNQMIAASARAEGVIEGRDKEQANPTA